MERARIAIVGDYDAGYVAHAATGKALESSGERPGIEVAYEWIGTESVARDGTAGLDAYDGLWVAPGSPYRSLDGALAAICFARERDRPFLGTWGGFQHTLLEYARNVLGIADAAHAEYGAPPDTALITPAHCEVPEPGAPRLKGKQRVRLTPGSLASRVYGANEIHEEFHCSNELNRRYQPLFERSTLRVVGVGDEGEARVVELAGGLFFIGTLYLPQLGALEAGASPLIDAYVRAAAGLSL